MVESISGVSSQYQQFSVSQTMTDDEKELLNEILANYDSENMTAEESIAMMDEIKTAGIKPSKELRETMDAAGFKPPEKPEGDMRGKPPVEGKEMPQEIA